MTRSTGWIKSILFSGVPGRLRSVEYRDKALLLEWFTNFHRDGLGGEPDQDRVEKQVDRFLNASPGQRGLMLWEVQGQPVSMAGYSGPTPNGIRIGAVSTPRELRKKGFASACTAGLSQALLNRGFKHCFLFTDLLIRFRIIFTNRSAISLATAEAVQQKGIQSERPSGTRFTMEEEFYRGRRETRHQLQILVPDQDERELVHRVIYDELVRASSAKVQREAIDE